MDRMILNSTFYRGLFALIFFTGNLCKQNPVFAQRFEFGAGVGVLNYKGDLNPQLNPLLSRPAIQGIFRYNFNMELVGRVNVLIGNLVGDGSKSSDIYISKIQANTFQTPIFEFAGGLEYNFFNYRNPKNRFIFGSPYLFGGPSISVITPEPVEKGGSISPVQFSLITGLGYKHQLGQFWNIGVEFGARFLFTDFLDNVSDKEVGTNFQRGNLYDYDIYTFLGINLTYTIKEIICPFNYQQADDNIKR